MGLDPATSDLQGLEFRAEMERSGERGIVDQAVALARNRCLGGESCEWRAFSRRLIIKGPQLP